MKGKTLARLMVIGLAVIAVAAFACWIFFSGNARLKVRMPGDDASSISAGETSNPVLEGKLIAGSGQPANLPGNWPQFRGPNRNGQVPSLVGSGVSSQTETTHQLPDFSRDWKTSPPRELWRVDVGEGYAGPAVQDGRVYLLDYDRDSKQSALRCLSLADGKEIWRYTYPLLLKRNHGMTRTVPAVTGSSVIALDSKCNALCLDSATGELRWSISLVREFGATVPQWYAGQCPIVDSDKVILAPGGKDVLALAVDIATGKPVWQTPNSHGWKMTHSSIISMDFGNRHQYLYCASGGVVGIKAEDGAVLWETPDWKISIATVPSPVPLHDGKVFLTGGYNAGSLMLQLQEQNGKITPNSLFRLTPEVFGATQQTPITKDNHLYGVRADGQFVCLDLNGKVAWTSGPNHTFGLGPFLMAGDLVFALNDSGTLRLIEATPARFNLLAEAQVLKGRECWGPMALAGDRLVLRDFTHLVCLDVGGK